MSIKYECDVCGSKAEASYKIDRYGYGLELCPEHTPKFFDNFLQRYQEIRTPLTDYNVMRMLIEAIGAQPPTPATELEPQEKTGTQQLHEFTDKLITFMKAQV